MSHRKNLFILGIDHFNGRKLEKIATAMNVNLHSLLTFPELQGPTALPVQEALWRCRHALDRFPGSIDGLMGYWDFPITHMVPLLCGELGLPAPSFESILKCEHKFWSRLEAKAVVPEHTPAFGVVDPFDEEALRKIDLDFPYWIKPVKSTDSQLAFRIRSEQDLTAAIPEIRKGIRRFSDPFNYFLHFAEPPEEIAEVDGRHCIVEASVWGRQCTVEGHAFEGRPRAHGVVDSIRYPGKSSFFRYEYPSRLPQRTRMRLTRISERLIEAIGLDSAGWNVEFFVDERTDRISLLEVNPRISQSHSHMFELVDGASNLEIVTALALGLQPRLPVKEGPFRCAAKFYVRIPEDACAVRVPTAKEVEDVENRFPGTLIHVKAEEGKWLSGLWEQDSYSFRVAEIHIGGRNTQELLRKFKECCALLPFEFSRAGRPPSLPTPEVPCTSSRSTPSFGRSRWASPPT